MIMNNDGYITIVSMIIPLFMELYKENKMKDICQKYVSKVNKNLNSFI